MAEYYNANEISEKLEEQLKICRWEKLDNGKSFMIELPVILYFNYQRLRLYIYPVDDGYYVSDDGETFVECSGDSEYYFNMFSEKDQSYHYEIGLKDDHICKRYDYDFSLLAALDEFVKFFVALENFMSAYEAGEFDN